MVFDDLKLTKYISDWRFTIKIDIDGVVTLESKGPGAEVESLTICESHLEDLSDLLVGASEIYKKED